MRKLLHGEKVMKRPINKLSFIMCAVTLKALEQSDVPKAKGLYFSAFPPEERPPYWAFSWRAKQKCTDWLGIYKDNSWIGFFYVINYEDLSYVCFFAIDDEFRGKGYGTSALQALKERYQGKRIFLAIEPIDPSAENYEQRVHRKAFYLRNGFEELPLTLTEGPVIYEVLGVGGTPEPEKFKQLVSTWTGWIVSWFFKSEIIPK